MAITNPTTHELLLEVRQNQKDIMAQLKQPSPTPVPAPQPIPVPTPTPLPTQTGKLFVPKTQLSTWLEAHTSDQNYALFSKLTTKPTFIWLNGNQSDIDLVKQTMTNCGDSIPCFVIYAIPDRDAQQYSAGGFKTVEAYNAWVGAIGYQVMNTGNKACVFAVEPDALGLLNDKPTTYPCINAAVDILKKNSNTKVFLDTSSWISETDMAGRVKGAGVERADGITANISGYIKTPDAETYAKNVLSHLKTGLQYIIDISRNGGTVASGDWCNPNGAKIGQDPQFINKEQVYAYGWIKLAGESDGQCNGGPIAGTLWIEGLLKLLK